MGWGKVGRGGEVRGGGGRGGLWGRGKGGGEGKGWGIVLTTSIDTKCYNLDSFSPIKY